MSFETIILDKKDGIATITFNRPKVFNAYSEQMSQELKAAVADVGSDTSLRVLVLKGSGENFLAGADINMLNSWSKISAEQGWEKVKEILDHHFSPTSLEKIPLPVIAAVDGMAWGMGSEIALGCDFRICTTRASFAQPEINLGIITGGGASQRLPRIVGKAKAMEMILTGKPINAADACKWGLVNEVVEPEGLDAAVARLAKAIMGKSPLMVKWAKDCVNLVLDHDLLSGIDKELTQFAKTFATQDSKEGTAAFLEKRKANFTGA
ncbi:enoyl-CoA hydratase/isomerase [Geobacter metallireducens GS-15]|uniref:Enoyl-CoA hydratase/isomerase n=1 Tax=Geobacter metallireducens (strain ATCC 53774 / DSM 7210 / GS-15) TaxID=269799 RepID=Q39TJ0_GEOMG|nr:enoyl-CoA hydratase/isomerase family protein [Geobacter metallireducens]ABB32434.1 enoyl-CoA hydratase/isomerase [Geobacter metallireducens GS-15]